MRPSPYPNYCEAVVDSTAFFIDRIEHKVYKVLFEYQMF